MKKRNLYYGVVGLFSLLCFVAGCKVGLGESIDTEKPTLKIVSPTSNILGGDITFEGVWDDDKGVREILVSVYERSNEANYFIKEQKAVVNDDKTWSYSLYTKTSSRAALAENEDITVLADGKYTIKVVAYDNANHDYDREQDFEIDCTAPVFLLSKPNSINIDDSSSFGRKIQITGDILESHNVTSMDIRLWSYDKSKKEATEITDKLAKTNFTGFATSGTAVTIAQYFKSEEEAAEKGAEDLYKNYLALYGSQYLESSDSESSDAQVKNPEWDTTKYYLMFVSLTDDAGNVTERVFSASKLNALVKSVTDGKLEVNSDKNSLRFLLENSYDGDLSEEEQETVLSILNGTGKYSDIADYGYLSDVENPLAFTVNSNADPTFSIDYKYSKGSWNDVGRDNPVTITLSAGLDGYEILPETLEFTLTPLDEDTLEPLEETAKIKKITIPKTHIFANNESIDGKTTSSTSFTYQITPGNLGVEVGVRGGICYALEITGKDENDNELRPAGDNNYGFKITSNASIPQISIESFTLGDASVLDSNSIENGEYIKAALCSADLEKPASLRFKITDEDDENMKLTVKKYIGSAVLSESKITASENAENFDIQEDFNGISLDENSEYRDSSIEGYNVDIPVELNLDGISANYTYALKVTAQKDETKGDCIFYFYADDKAPEMELTNVELSSWNGTDLLLISNITNTASKKELNGTKEHFIVNGNSFTYDGDYYEYTVNGRWSDEGGSGTNRVYYSIDSEEKDTGTWGVLDENDAPQTQKSVKWSFTTPIYHGEGENRKINYYAVDSVGNETEVRPYKNIVFDFEIPKIIEKNGYKLASEYKKNDAAKVILSLSDTNALKPNEIIVDEDGNQITVINAVQLEIYKDGEKINQENWVDYGISVEYGDITVPEMQENTYYMLPDKKEIKVSSMDVTISFTTDGTQDGEYTIKANAVDIAGRKSESITLTTTIDGTIPSFKDDLTIKGDEGYKTGKYYADSTLKVAGSYEENGTGMDTLYYYLKRTGETISFDDSDLTKVDLSKISGIDSYSFKKGSNEFSITVEDFDDTKNENTNTLYFQAVDSVGNMSIATKQNINVDTAKPELETDGLDSAYYNEGTPSLTVSAKDYNLSELNVIIRDDNNATLSASDYEEAGITIDKGELKLVEEMLTATATVSFNADGNHDGKFTVTAEAVDAAGKSSGVKTLTTTIDATKPEFKDDLKIGNAVWSGNSWYKDTTLKLSGSFTETTSGMDVLYYYVQYPGRSAPEALTDITADSAHDGDLSFKSGAEDFSFTVEAFTNNTSEAANVIYIQAADKAGNASEIKQFTINVDTTAPELSAQYYQIGSNSITTAGGIAYVNGSAAITVYGNYSDEQSGVGELTFAYGESSLTPASVKYSTEEITGTDNEPGIPEETAFKAYGEVDKFAIKSWKAVFTPTTGGKFSLAGSNGAGLNASDIPFTIKLDNTSPSLSNFSITGTNTESSSTPSVSAYKKSEGVYYINNKNKVYTISGIATDDVGVDTVSLIIKDAAGTEVSDFSATTTATEWSFENLDLSSSDLGTFVTAELTVTDVAGNSRVSSLTINFDTTVPNHLHIIDAKNKDLYFRIGENDNDDIDETNSLWDDSLDTNVGGKYSEGTYGNSSTIRIRGNFQDSGSGVKMIYYKVFTSEPGEEELEAVKSLSSYTGYFAPLSETETKRVFYNVAAGGTNTIGGEKLSSGSTYDKYYINIESSYNSTISGFTEGNNYLVLVAVDNVGNVGINYATVPTTDENGNTVEKTYYCSSVNVDIGVPNVKSNNEDIIYTNGTEKIEISGTVTDEVAGVKSITFKVGNSNLTIPATSFNLAKNDDPTETDGNKYNWTAEIAKSYFEKAGNYTVYATATDKAGTGNTTTISVATISVDKTAPTVKVINPADADTSVEGIQVNKKITLTGTANDLNGIDEILDLYYSTASSVKPADNANLDAEGSGWTKIAAANTNNEDSEKTSWSFNEIDTEKLNGTLATSGTVYITAGAKDSAGNIGYATPIAVVINQDTDRPVINISNVTLKNGDNPLSETNRVWVKNSSIIGTVSDDDGEVEGLYISLDDGDNKTWSDNLISGGTSWDYDVTDNDGSKNLYFKVVDAENSEFISSAGSTDALLLASPKLNNKGSNKYGYKESDGGESTSSILYTKIDLTSPKLNKKYIKKTLEEGDTLDALISYSEESEFKTNGWKSLDEWTEICGGKDSKVYVFIHASDANGIGSSVLKLNNTEITEPEKQSSGENYYALYTVPTDSYNGNTIPLNISATDNAGLSISYRTSVNIDNEAPSINITGLANGASLFGSMENSVSGTATDSTIGIGVEKIYYGLSKDINTEPASTGYNEIQSFTGTTSWTINWKEEKGSTPVNIDNSGLYNDYKLNYYLDSLYGSGTSENDDTKLLYLWLKVEDKLGNCSKPIVYALNVIPQGDKPSISVSYPDSGATVGGTIRLTGSTSIATGSVSKVYVQIDPAYNAETGFNSDGWKDAVNALINGKDVDYTIADDITSIGSAIEASGTVSWNLSINKKSEFNLDTENRSMAIRVYAVSSTNKVSEPVVVPFTLDPGSPVFGNTTPIKLVQYENNESGTGEIVASKVYTNGMWLKDIWYLVGSVEDDSGISEIELTDSSNSDGSVSIISGSKVSSIEMKDSEGNIITGKYNYNLNIPIGKETGAGYVKYTIVATENASEGETAKTSKLELEINYDNIQPEFSANLENSGNEVVNSNGTYEMTGSLTESGSQSGFSRIAFYFTRTINEKTYIIDPMLVQGEDGTANRYDVASDDEGFTNDTTDNLYWRSTTIANEVASGTVITISGSVPANVRKGGLCKINNVIYRIDGVAGTQITLDSTLPEIKAGTSVYFALAQVIDNTQNETGTTTYWGNSNISSDDGDQMSEQYTMSTGAWRAAINSRNILDGDVTIYFTAFDKAGNIAKKSYSGTVKNNGPRIAGITFGTDLNGNGTIEDSELESTYSGKYNADSTNKYAGVTVNGYDGSNNRITSMDISNPILTIKGDSVFRPEIVGGNGGLDWKYAVAQLSNGEYSDAYYTSDFVELTDVHSSSDEIRSYEQTEIKLTILDLLKAEPKIQDAERQKFTFTISDRTEGTVTGYGQKAEFNIIMNVAISDEIKPTAKIYPFYWNSKTDNSLSWDSTNENPEGHIELENDLPSETFTSSNSGVYDIDPKVSGKIYLRGEANDNVLLKELWLKFPGITVNASNSNFIQVAKRNDNGKWEAVSGLPDGITFDAAFTNAEGNDEFDNNEGNTVKWQILIDTAKISNVAATDVEVEIQVKDRGKATLNDEKTSVEYNAPNESESVYSNDEKTIKKQTSGEQGSSDNAPYYRMDVVPYITNVTTNLSAFNRNKPSVYARTAIGNYSVKVGEQITINGFNLKSTSDTVVTINDVASSFTSSSQSATSIVGTIASAATSGDLELYAYDGTNKIYALNNKNKNNSYGTAESIGTAYENGYNRQPNGLNNNLLTDDVVLDVYEFTTVATPQNGSISDPFMRINPKTGQPGFSFNNAVLYFNMPGFEQTGTTTYSHTTFGADNGGYTNGTFAWDANGNSYGIATCTDTGWPAESVSTVLFSRRAATLDSDNWNTQQAYKNAIYQRGIESTTISLTADQPTAASNYTTDTGRVMSPAITTTVSGTTTTLYVAYYDRLTKQVRFRTGTVANDANTIGGALQDIFYRTTAGSTLRGAPDSIYVDGSSKSGYDNSTTTISQTTVTGTSNGRIEIVAAKSLGTSYLAAYQNNTTYGPGEYVDIGVSGSYVVIVWYDSVNRKLMISYENPSSLSNDKTMATGTLAYSGDWQSNAFAVEDTTGVGLYVKMAVDPAGGIHLAYYNNNGADLKYAYISPSDLTSKKVTKVQTVDAYLSTGARPTIDVTRVVDNTVSGGYDYVPYIGYQMNSNLNTTASARIAHPVKFDSNGIAAGDGADSSDMYTGNWEVKTVPTENTPIDAKVSAGVWTSGTNKVHTAIPHAANTFEAQNGTKTINSQATGQRAIIWGNGTLYPVISYAVSEDGKLEMAQQK